jgi:hypothetical protein
MTGREFLKIPAREVKDYIESEEEKIRQVIWRHNPRKKILKWPILIITTSQGIRTFYLGFPKFNYLEVGYIETAKNKRKVLYIRKWRDDKLVEEEHYDRP